MKRVILLFAFFVAVTMAIPSSSQAQTTVLKEYQITATDNSKVFNLFVNLTANSGVSSVLFTDPENSFHASINSFSYNTGGYEVGSYEADCYFHDGNQYYTVSFTLLIDGNGSGEIGEGLIAITPWPYPWAPY